MDCRHSNCLAGGGKYSKPKLRFLRQRDCGSCQQSWGPRRPVPFAANAKPQCKVEPGAGTIVVEIDGVTVRVGRGVDTKTLMPVLGAWKAGA